MRVIKFLLVSLLILTALSSIGFLIGRELYLLLAVSQVRTAVSQMRTIASNSSFYISECQKKGAINTDLPAINRIQLRFTSDRDYVVEVVCNQFELSPLVVQTKSLPWLIKTLPGSSGILWDSEKSGIALTLFNRTKTIILSGKNVSYSNLASTDLGVGPQTNCAGYGHTCCPTDASVGVGSQITSATDCPKTCFLSCVDRPLILSLVTQPFFAPNSRQVNIADGEVVEFNFTFDDNSGPIKQVVFDFGDGQVENLTSETTQATHAYTCANSLCEFSARLKITNAQGISSLENELSQVKVVVGK